MTSQLRKNVAILAAALLLTGRAIGQEADHTSTYHNITSEGYIRLQVDNDYFTGSDEQYTEGLTLEVAAPWLKNDLLSGLLLHPRFNNVRYGVGIEQAGYTPMSLYGPQPAYGERPFAGVLMAKAFMIADDPGECQRYAATFYAGVLGPAAQAGDIQDGAHVLINNGVPHGWKYQVQNDLILNYDVRYEQQVLYSGNYMIASAEATAAIGTLKDKVGGGINVIAGIFESPYTSEHTGRKRFQVYGYTNPHLDVVLYDATLQGGVFSNNSPYTMGAAAITRVVLTNRAGVAIQANGWRLELNECYSTGQYLHAPSHLYGSIQIAYTLNNKRLNDPTVLKMP